VVLSIVLDQFEGYRKVSQWIGGKQHRPTAGMDFINTQDP
jgi:hypothetical protein